MENTCKNCMYISDVRKVEKEHLVRFCKLHKIVVHEYHLFTTKCNNFKEVKE